MSGVFASLVIALSAVLQSANAPLADAQAEARARALMKEIRCLVCQNQSIEDSNAEIASDLRRFVRTEIVAGETDAAIKQALVARYGDWVLLRPPFDARTLVLWLSPLLILLAAGAGFLLSRRGRTAAPTPLNAAEKARLAELLDEGEPHS